MIRATIEIAVHLLRVFQIVARLRLPEVGPGGRVQPRQRKLAAAATTRAPSSGYFSKVGE